MHTRTTIRTLVLLAAAFLISHSCAGAPNPSSGRAPNILWIYLEDTSPLMGAYGAQLVATPNIDALAARGVVFTNAFAPAPVCSPSRSAVITGAMATTLGLHNHHSSRTPESAIRLPDGYRTIPELFRNAGYSTFNNGKDDYNFEYDRHDLYQEELDRHPLYGKRGKRIDLAGLKDRQPFFGQIQLAGGKELFSSRFEDQLSSRIDRAKVEVPPYLPAHPTIVEEYARHLDTIQLTDAKVGKILAQLQRAGVADNTVVFFFSDHGMRLTRHKQFVYDGGIHIPLIVADLRRDPSIAPGSQFDGLVSGIDLGTSSLALADIPIPDHMEGVDVFDNAFEGREYIIATRDRCDFTIDRIRAVRTKQFKYIRNFLTDRPHTQTTYMDVDGVAFVKTMRELHAQEQLNAEQAQFFANDRPAEELYDLKSDPFELHNLANSQQHQRTKSQLAAKLDAWIAATGDQGQHPEPEPGLKLMLGIWGDHANNPEYQPLREKYANLSGSQFHLKRAGWTPAKN